MISHSTRTYFLAFFSFSFIIRPDMKDTFTQFVRLGLIILALGVCLYWVDSTWFAPRRLPPCVQSELDAAGKNHICWDTLKGRHGNNIIWIDARSDADYEVNRLAGRDVCMFHIRPRPFELMQQQADRAMARLDEAADRGECIVVFCTNNCTDSEDVAAYLKECGIEAPFYVLEGGWDTIKIKAPEMLEAR